MWILRSLAILVRMGGQNSAFKQEPHRVLIQTFQGPHLEREKKMSIYWPYPRNKEMEIQKRFLPKATHSFHHSVI